MTAPIQQLSQLWHDKKAPNSRFGIVLVMLYLILTVLTVLAAWYTGDDKGRFVLLQLPLALQMALLDTLGLMGWFAGLSWSAAYFVFVPATCICLYHLGKSLSCVWRHHKLLTVGLILLPVLLAYFWVDLIILLS